MQSQPGQLTTVQNILKGKLGEIVIQYKEILDTLKKVDQFINEAETKVMTVVTKKVTSYSLNLASHFDLMQDKLNICMESMEDMVHFHYSDSNENEKSKRSFLTQQCSSSVSYLLKQKLETLEEKMSSLETHVLAKENNLSSRLYKTEAKQMLMEQILVGNDDVVIQGKADLSKIRQDVDRLASQHEVWRQDLEEFKEKMAALEILRDALNKVNKNVSSRRDLSKKLKELEGDLTQVKSTVAKLDSTSTKQGKIWRYMN
ncbi:unnamed protein product [Lymnaea stagnalis]|uniref:Uncharacterized protein n=1 Tax=Lymnaea stagnalis TaxID=6523 RepID=A0AAV2HY94_LYMST